MKRCIRCVLPDTFPGITFNEDGLCSMCQDFDKGLISEEKVKVPNYTEKIEKIIAKAKESDCQYHAIVAYSGGKDSTYLLHVLKNIYKLKVLAVTFDNGYIPASANKNIRKVVDSLNIDHFYVKYNRDVVNRIITNSTLKDMYPMNLIKCGSGVCISCIRMVNNMVTRIAVEKNIPMIMLGNSPGQLVQTKNEIVFKDNFIPYMMRKKLYEPLAKCAGDDIYYYMMLTEKEYEKKPFPYTINLLAAINYDESEIYSVISKYGWEKPSDVDPNSTNCCLNSYGILKHKEVYGFHPYENEMSVLVRLGKLSREEALRRVEDREGKVKEISIEVENELKS